MSEEEPGPSDGGGSDESPSDGTEQGGHHESDDSAAEDRLAETAIAEATAATGDAAERPPTDRQADVDEFFEVLSSPGNRFVLTYLLRVDGPAEYADLVEYVVAETGTPSGMTTEKFRGRVAATLVSDTVPQLEAAGFVDVDSENQVVTPTESVHAAAPHLALVLSSLTTPTDS